MVILEDKSEFFFFFFFVNSEQNCPTMQVLDNKDSSPSSLSPLETSREHSKGRSACVHFSPSEGSDGNRHPGASSVEKSRGETVGEQQCDKGKGSLKQPSCVRGSGPAEEGEDPSWAAASLPQQDGH